MKIWKIWGLDDLAPVVGALQAAYSGFNIQPTGGAPGATDIVFFNDRYWCHGTPTNSSPLANIAGNGFALNGKLVFAGRVWTDSPTLNQFGSMYNPSTGLLVGAILMSQIGVTAGKEFYVEVVIDFVALTHTFYVNGNPTPTFTRTYTTAQMAQIPTCCFMFGGNGSGTGNWYARDIHFREYTPGESYVPLTSGNVRQIQVAAVNAPGYVSSNGDTPTNVLNSPFVDLTTSYSAPTIDNAIPAGSILSATLVDKPGISGNILGFELFDTAKSTETPAGTLVPNITQNSASAAGVPLALTAAFQNRKSIGIYQTMPDGSTITKAKINTTRLTLTAT